jgi:hypothetical protein
MLGRWGDVEATGKLRSGSPLHGGGDRLWGSLKHKANEEDVRGKLVRRKGGSSGEIGRPLMFGTDEEGSRKASLVSGTLSGRNFSTCVKD